MSEPSVTATPAPRRKLVEGYTLLMFPSTPRSLPAALLDDLPEGCIWECKVVRVHETDGG